MVWELREQETKRIKDSAINQALETIRNRIDQFGVAEPIVLRQGLKQIVVQLPGVKDPKRAKDLIKETALLEFKMLDEDIRPRSARACSERQRSGGAPAVCRQNAG